MSHALAPSQRRLLAGFAQSRLLVALDFDGTLAPIVDHPRDAGLPPRTRELLRSVSALYPCVVISGRATADVRALLRGSGVRHVIGNHGADLAERRRLRRQVRSWIGALQEALDGMPGVWIEDKGLSLAVHYRNTARGTAVRQCIRRAARALPDVRLTPAKQALNIVAAEAPNKGEALAHLLNRLNCDRAIYVGDDTTDEDVFARNWQGKLLGVRVGRARSKARLHLRRQPEIDRLLELLIELRRPASRGPRQSTAASTADNSRNAPPDWLHSGIQRSRGPAK